MADPRVPLYYWDACVFLTAINGGPEDRLPTINALLDDLDAGSIRIVTSDVSITEVACAEHEKNEDTLDPAVEAKIDGLWHPSSPIKLIEYHQLIAEEAKQLMRAVLPRR